MPDYKVKIKTDSGQFRDCIVRDFVYSSDAEKAALSQTGGGQVWSVSPHSDKTEETSSWSDTSYNQSSNNEGWDTSDWYDDEGNITRKGEFGEYALVTALPTLILLFVHPIASILWNVGFSKLWFGWKFWFE